MFSIPHCRRAFISQLYRSSMSCLPSLELNDWLLSFSSTAPPSSHCSVTTRVRLHTEHYLTFLSTKGYAAMNVRPSLLDIYERHFLPLGERLRPALSGFLSGVLPGLESGLDHFERTNSLLTKVCSAVGPNVFFNTIWECVANNSSIRLPALTYVIDHYNKRVGE